MAASELGEARPDSKESCKPKAEWNGVILAQSDDTVVVEGNHYFPAAPARANTAKGKIFFNLKLWFINMLLSKFSSTTA